MNCRTLAEQLVDAQPGDRESLFSSRGACRELDLARELREICYEVWAADPRRVNDVVGALEVVASSTANMEVAALLAWTRAIGHLVAGNLAECLTDLEKADEIFTSLGLHHDAATTRISRLYALALLGRYDEAVECGMSARDVFAAENDLFSLAKIEHNIGNLYIRRDLYDEAEHHYRAAHCRFVELDDQRQAAMLENNLGFTFAARNRFREAEQMYRAGLERAAAHGLLAIQADLEASMSTLCLFQGRFDESLRLLELARRKYDELEMPHHSAGVELELADIYLELNLLPEAIASYEKMEAGFRSLGMRAELARALRNHARALSLAGDRAAAAEFFERAREIFNEEGNRIAAAAVKLFRASDLFADGAIDAADEKLRAAIGEFADGGSVRLELTARHLSGEIAVANGDLARADAIFSEVLDRSADRSRQLEYLSLVSLGRLRSDEALLRRAIDIAENLREALAAEEYRTAFLSNKTLPYDELARIAIARGDLVGAFREHERGRARSLRDILASSGDGDSDASIKGLRDELNWLYSRLSRRNESISAVGDLAELRRKAENLEREYAAAVRRSKVSSGNAAVRAGEFDPEALRAVLGETKLVEFFAADGRLSAFVLDRDGLRLVDRYSDFAAVGEAVNRYLFQLRTARTFSRLGAQGRAVAVERMRRHAARVYDLVLRPLKLDASFRRIAFAPTGALHHLPFHALFDGEAFVAERRETVVVPGAAVLQSCLERRREDCVDGTCRAVVCGFADALTPHVDDEVAMLANLFEKAKVLSGSDATTSALRRECAGADLVHIASHGSFRRDNPAFSALQFADGRLTAADASTLPLDGAFVVLSSCESGRGSNVGGEESIGLARALMAAGATTLLLSYWTVDDRAALALMREFYVFLKSGHSAAAALKAAQTQLMQEFNHPYFWGAFSLFGSW